MSTSLIEYKYREGKVKRTLKRELEVLEIVMGEASVATDVLLAEYGFTPDRGSYRRVTAASLLLCGENAALCSELVAGIQNVDARHGQWHKA